MVLRTQYIGDEKMDLHGSKILVAEDDKNIFKLIKAMLKPYEINLSLEENGQSALTSIMENDYHLILLDIMLPDKDGWEICREIKNANIDTPIIMLTAKAEETDKVLGLELGADDYVTKPFSPRELIARIKAVLRRYEQNKQPPDSNNDEIINFPDISLKIFTKKHKVLINDSPIDLTPKEFELLVFLCQHPQQVFKRKQLLNQIWGYNNFSQSRTVDEHIKRLRKKIADSGLKEIPIHTVWGIGYKFEV